MDACDDVEWRSATSALVCCGLFRSWLIQSTAGFRLCSSCVYHRPIRSRVLRFLSLALLAPLEEEPPDDAAAAAALDEPPSSLNDTSGSSGSKPVSFLYEKLV